MAQIARTVVMSYYMERGNGRLVEYETLGILPTLGLHAVLSCCALQVNALFPKHALNDIRRSVIVR